MSVHLILCNHIFEKKFDETILKEILRTKEVLAICIGLQILFYKSEEGKHKGINIFEKKN